LSSELFGAQLQVIEDVPTAIRTRLKKGWTQAELARRVGMQRSNIARLEGGHYYRVSLPTRKKIARAPGAEIELSA
jgi:transcriptional regulator with XRE-family HTH domain